MLSVDKHRKDCRNILYLITNYYSMPFENAISVYREISSEIIDVILNSMKNIKINFSNFLKHSEIEDVFIQSEYITIKIIDVLEGREGYTIISMSFDGRDQLIKYNVNTISTGETTVELHYPILVIPITTTKTVYKQV